MNTVRLNAYAKLNLTLDITGREGGYHLLDSLVVTVDLSDRIVAQRRKDQLISVTMKGMGSESIPPEKNNAQKAGERFVERFQTTGANITVYKNIPIGAGLGGSSTDASGVLNALAKLYGVTDEVALKEIADSLGSDTGYLLKGGFARMQGRGEKVQTLSLPALNFLLICPKSAVSTPSCYQKYDELAQDVAPCTEEVIALLKSGNLQGAGGRFFNALSLSAQALNGDVAQAIAEAESFSPLGVCMTGSGSAVFALFETMELCLWAQSRYRGKFRTYCVRSVLPNEEKKQERWRNPFVLSEGECEKIKE